LTTGFPPAIIIITRVERRRKAGNVTLNERIARAAEHSSDPVAHALDYEDMIDEFKLYKYLDTPHAMVLAWVIIENFDARRKAHA
jgi:hypothetical protein